MVTAEGGEGGGVCYIPGKIERLKEGETGNFKTSLSNDLFWASFIETGRALK